MIIDAMSVYGFFINQPYAARVLLSFIHHSYLSLPESRLNNPLKFRRLSCKPSTLDYSSFLWRIGLLDCVDFCLDSYLWKTVRIIFHLETLLEATSRQYLGSHHRPFLQILFCRSTLNLKEREITSGICEELILLSNWLKNIITFLEF
jgi:hypothetical protein